MPIGVTNRDFCNLRTWRADHERNEFIIFNFSVIHPDCPEKKSFVRARSLKTGYFVRDLGQGNGCEFIYYSQSDPRGWIPTWVINMLMTKLPPKLLDKLHKVSIAYPGWKSEHKPDHKPWLNGDSSTGTGATSSVPAESEKKKKKKGSTEASEE